jgi:hypothetical protein
MSKSRTAPVVNLADFKKKMTEEHAMVINLGDGVTVRYRGPELLSDDEMTRMVELEKAKDPASVVEIAKIMVDDYDAFVAAGGSAMMLMEMVKHTKQQLAEDDAEGERLGESVPPSDS